MIAMTTISSPVGTMQLTVEGETLTKALFLDDTGIIGQTRTTSSSSVLSAAEEQLTAYFAGELEEFTLPVAAARGTTFQRAVWEELRSIPYGVTTSYGAIAARLGMRPGASRAVGLANGANPIAIIVPCHRVIGAKGKLVGYAGGLERKRYLLGLETPDLLFS